MPEAPDPAAQPSVVSSRIPFGSYFHRAVRRVTSRHIVEQRRELEQEITERDERIQALVDRCGALEESVRELVRERTRDGWDRQAQDAVVARHTVSIERLDEQAAALDAAMTALSDRAGALARPDGSFSFEPWYDTNAFARVFRGQGLVERYKDLLGRFVGHGPVLDIGCGDGQFVAELEKLGLRARGVDVDPATIAVALEQGLNVELADGMEALAACAPGSLGGILCIQVIEHLPRQAVIDLPRLAARALVPGGILVIETVNPASLYAMTHWYYLDPTHLQPIPADLITFLTGQAGFSASEVEWRSPVAGSELLPPADEPEGVGPRTAERLNQVLFAAQDYAVIATR